MFIEKNIRQLDFIISGEIEITYGLILRIINYFYISIFFSLFIYYFISSTKYAKNLHMYFDYFFISLIMDSSLH